MEPSGQKVGFGASTGRIDTEAGIPVERDGSLTTKMIMARYEEQLTPVELQRPIRRQVVDGFSRVSDSTARSPLPESHRVATGNEAVAREWVLRD
jgi:hypothetical protein